MGGVISTPDFRKWLENGLGRAILYVMQHDVTDQREVILDACLVDKGYDRQVDDRSPYMREIIKYSHDQAFYRACILESLLALPDDADDYDVDQQYDLAAYFARNGDPQARQVIYDKFTANMALADFSGAYYLIELDGIEGFAYVADLIGQGLLAHGDTFLVNGHDYGVDDGFIYDLQEAIGKEAATEAIARLRSNNLNIAAYLDVAYQAPVYLREPVARVEPDIGSYEAMKQALDTDRNFSKNWYAWGKRADAESLAKAAYDLIQETDTERIEDYLWAFNKTTFPLDHTKLFELAQGGNDRVSGLAFAALKNIRQPIPSPKMR